MGSESSKGRDGSGITNKENLNNQEAKGNHDSGTQNGGALPITEKKSALRGGSRIDNGYLLDEPDEFEVSEEVAELMRKLEKMEEEENEREYVSDDEDYEKFLCEMDDYEEYIRDMNEYYQSIQSILYDDDDCLEEQTTDTADDIDLSKIVSKSEMLQAGVEAKRTGACPEKPHTPSGKPYITNKPSVSQEPYVTRSFNEPTDVDDEGHYAFAGFDVNTLHNKDLRILFFKNNWNTHIGIKALDTFYPEKYASKLKHLVADTGISANKNNIDGMRLAEKVLSLPTLLDVNFNLDEADEQLDEIIGNSNSLKTVRDIVLGHFTNLQEFAKHKNLKISLKELAETDQLSSHALLLVGKPGCGKSWIGQIIAEIMQVNYLNIDCPTTDHLGLIGSSLQWSNTKEGLIANKLIETHDFLPIIILDEIDKTGHTNENYLIDTINKIIDPNIVADDAHLSLPLYHLKSTLFILTANNESAIPDYIKSRADVIYVDAMPPDLIVKNVLKRFIKTTSTLHDCRRLLNSSKVQNILLNLVLRDNIDFRALTKQLKSTLYLYQNEVRRSGLTDIEDFFYAVLSTRLSPQKPSKGFMGFAMNTYN